MTTTDNLFLDRVRLPTVKVVAHAYAHNSIGEKSMFTARQLPSGKWVVKDEKGWSFVHWALCDNFGHYDTKEKALTAIKAQEKKNAPKI